MIRTAVFGEFKKKWTAEGSFLLSTEVYSTRRREDTHKALEVWQRLASPSNTTIHEGLHLFDEALLYSARLQRVTLKKAAVWVPTN